MLSWRRFPFSIRIYVKVYHIIYHWSIICVTCILYVSYNHLWGSCMDLNEQKKHCVFICFSVRKYGFLRISEKSIVDMKSLIWKWMNKNRFQFFRIWGNSGNRSGKLKNHWETLCFLSFRLKKSLKNLWFWHSRPEKHNVFQWFWDKNIEKPMVFALQT